MLNEDNGFGKTRKAVKCKKTSREAPVSESEQELFGGALRRDTNFMQGTDEMLKLGFWGLLKQLPSILVRAVRLAWRADRRAVVRLGLSEVGRGITDAVSLVMMNAVLATLLAATSVNQGLRDALPAIIMVAAMAAGEAVLAAVSAASTGRLQPKVERVVMAEFIGLVSTVEMAAVEDADFRRLMDSARFAAQSARRLIAYVAVVITSLLSLVAAAGVLTTLHPVLLPLLVAMTLPQAGASLLTARRQYRNWHQWIHHQRANQLIAGMMTDTDAAMELRTHGMGDYLLRHYEGMARSFERAQEELATQEGWTRLAGSSMTGVFAVATYATLGALVWSGMTALSVAGTAVLAIRNGSSALNNLVRQVTNLHEEGLFLGDLDKLRAAAQQRAIPRGGLPLPAEPEEIRFEQVSFTYPGDQHEQALKGVSLSIPAGKIVALVGENGSGKTTLVKLLAGLYAPQEGRVCWDGVDAQEADRRDLCSRIALVSQDFFRWPFTARTNVTVGRVEASVGGNRLAGAVEYSGAASFIKNLPRGWETLLSRDYHGGHELSGGQWQKLGIARAHYREGQVLIVDEPTAALDAKAEIEVFEKIRKLADAGQTVVLITHRLASVRHADLVYVLEDGRLIEQGSPEELLTSDGLYREMYDLQAAQFAVDFPRQAVAGER